MASMATTHSPTTLHHMMAMAMTNMAVMEETLGVMVGSREVVVVVVVVAGEEVRFFVCLCCGHDPFHTVEA